jgi:transcription elongation GreA/GreB family factor
MRESLEKSSMEPIDSITELLRRRKAGRLLGMAVNKRALIKKIIARLTDELAVYYRAAQFSRVEATHEQNKPESKYDTRGLEASYLARGQSRQALELETAIATYEKFAAKPFAPGEGIDLGAMVELEQGGERNYYFVGPCSGGTEVTHDKKEVLVITLQSPLGQQLHGKKQNDVLKVNGQNPFRIVAVM